MNMCGQQVAQFVCFRFIEKDKSLSTEGKTHLQKEKRNERARGQGAKFRCIGQWKNFYKRKTTCEKQHNEKVTATAHEMSNGKTSPELDDSEHYTKLEFSQKLDEWNG